jgi:hypothetical protein
MKKTEISMETKQQIVELPKGKYLKTKIVNG